MRKHTLDNKKELSLQAEQLIQNMNFCKEKLDYNTIKNGVDYLIDTDKFYTAEEVLRYHLHRDGINDRNYFALLCRGLFLCSLEKYYDSKIKFYSELLKELSKSNPSVVSEGENYPLYMLYKFNSTAMNKLLGNGRENWLREADIIEKFKKNFKLIADSLNTFSYYNAYFYYSKDKYPKFVLEVLKDAAKVEKNDESIYINAHICQKKIGEKSTSNSSIKLLNNALNINPFNAETWAMLGETYLNEENFSEAVNAFRKCEILDKNNYAYILNVAKCYFKNEDFANALVYFQKYISHEENPYKNSHFFEIGECFMNLGQFDEAIESFDKHIKYMRWIENDLDASGHLIILYDENTLLNSLVHKVICLLKSGKTEEAAKTFFEAENSGELEDYKNRNILKAQILMALGLEKETETFLMQMVERNNYNDYTLKTLFEFQLKHESYLLARVFVNLLREIDSCKSTALLYEAVIDYKCGDEENAARLLDQANETDALAYPNFKSYCPESEQDINFINLLNIHPF